VVLKPTGCQHRTVMSSPSTFVIAASVLAGSTFLSLISPRQRIKNPGIQYSDDGNDTLLDTLWVRLESGRSGKEGTEHKAVHILYEMGTVSSFFSSRGTFVKPVMSTTNVDPTWDVQRLDDVQDTLDEGVTFVVLSPDGEGSSWAKCDKNKDGKVSPDEMSRALDINGDGIVTVKEVLKQWPDVHIKLPLVDDHPSPSQYAQLWASAKDLGMSVLPLLVADALLMCLVAGWFLFWPGKLPAGTLKIDTLEVSKCKAGTKLVAKVTSCGCQHETGVFEVKEASIGAKWQTEGMKFMLNQAASGTKLKIEVFDESTDKRVSVGTASFQVRKFVDCPGTGTHYDSRKLSRGKGAEIQVGATFVAT